MQNIAVGYSGFGKEAGLDRPVGGHAFGQSFHIQVTATMITVLLRGQLGNQLFQYACARHLSIKKQATLRFDLSWFGLRRNASYALKHFRVFGRPLNPLPQVLAKKVLGENSFCKLQNRLHRMRNISELRYDGHEFTPEILNTPYDNIYLNGLFQSEKFFKPIEDVIRKELRPKDIPSDDAVRVIRDQIDSTESVSVHIRRTDYVGRRRFDILTPDYYERAIRYVLREVESPNFFVFSDDIVYCRRHIQIPNCTYVELPLASQYPIVDFELMSRCKHNISANSSFSWWPAWLNPNPNKLVITPNAWIYPPEEVPMSDKVPDSWIQIELA